MYLSTIINNQYLPTIIEITISSIIIVIKAFTVDYIIMDIIDSKAFFNIDCLNYNLEFVTNPF